MSSNKILDKVAHVKGAKFQAGHKCHWPGCDRHVKPAFWGCTSHWYALPQALRAKIWRTYEIGQEETKTPSREYVAVAREVQAWIAGRK